MNKKPPATPTKRTTSIPQVRYARRNTPMDDYEKARCMKIHDDEQKEFEETLGAPSKRNGVRYARLNTTARVTRSATLSLQQS
jgi:hypothetical protein